MSRYDFRTPRLFVRGTLRVGVRVPLDRGQMSYLMTVLRLRTGASVLVFNGADGEWDAELCSSSKKEASLLLRAQTRVQAPGPDLHLCFAPLKHARLDYLVQKAVELGASRLSPVMTRHTQSERVNRERMRANVIEAAEQCGVLNLPEVDAPITFDEFLRTRDTTRLLVFCDEDAEVRDPLAALARARTGDSITPCAVLIGPEGGFAAEERTALIELANVVRLSLGPRILRADTAATAALALVQATLGDWH